MIIQIRGTSGSGKTTVVMRTFKNKAFGKWTPIFVPKRRKPLYYTNGPIALIGHYESEYGDFGGCDTIHSVREAIDLIKALYKKYRLIICEGLLLSEDSKRTMELAQKHELRAWFLSTPLEQCLSQIASRRKKRGNDKPFNPRNTVRRIRPIESARVKLTQAGIPCYRMSCSQASIRLKLLVEKVLDEV